MIFITGGQAQGKTEFAYSFFQDKDIAAADGRCSGYGEALEAELILHLECYVLRLMQEGTEPAVFAGELIEKNGGAVDGRVCQKIAAFSDEVYRVVCGLGSRIK